MADTTTIGLRGLTLLTHLNLKVAVFNWTAVPRYGIYEIYGYNNRICYNTLKSEKAKDQKVS